MSVKEVESVCTYCGVGCEISVIVLENKIQKVYAKEDSIVSRGKLCIKGKAGWDFVYSADRLPEVKIRKSFIYKNELYFPKDIRDSLSPDIKDDEEFIYPSLKLACKIVAWKLQRVADLHGSDSIGGIGGARSSCESGYVFQKLIREVLLSPNIDNCARVCHAPSLKGMRKVIGEGAATNPFDDIEKSDFILVIGSNTTEAHPIVAMRITKALRAGKKVAVFDVRETHLGAGATFDCIIPFESNLLVLNMISFVILNEELYDKEYIKNRVKGFDEYKKLILQDKYADPEFFRNIKGYEYLCDMIKGVAREYAKGKSIILWGLGVTEHIDGSYAVEAMCNLAVITGNIGKEGCGLMPLRGQNNVQGVCDMGCLPYYRPGYKEPDREGLKTPEMVDAAIEGKIKAIVNMGEDLAHIHPNQDKIRKALEKLDFLVVLDLFENATTKYADIIFGVKSTYEKRGVYINAERRVQLASPIVESPYPDDWEVVCEISKNLSGFFYQSSKEIWKDVQKEVFDRFGGASYETLEKQKGNAPQWPIDKDGCSTSILHKDTFRTEDEKAHLSYRKYFLRGATGELLRGELKGFYLTTGRVISQYNNSSQTKRCPTLQKRYIEDILHVSFQDSDFFQNVKKVILVSKQGKSSPLRVKITKKLKKGMMFCSFHYLSSGINELFSDEGDELTRTARFKSVKVEVLRIFGE